MIKALSPRIGLSFPMQLLTTVPSATFLGQRFPKPAASLVAPLVSPGVQPVRARELMIPAASFFTTTFASSIMSNPCSLWQKTSQG